MHVSHGGAPAEALPADCGRAAEPRRLRVLVVDDVDEQRSVYEAVLSHAGFEVVHARSGAEAVERALRSRPDLIVLDLRLPDLNGLEVFGILYEQACAAAVPVIAVTADTMRYPASSVLPLGFDAYLAKPVNPLELRRVALSLTVGPEREEPHTDFA